MLNLHNMKHYRGYTLTKTPDGIAFKADDVECGDDPRRGILPTIEGAIRRIDEIEELTCNKRGIA